MPDTTALRPGDPEEVAGYRVLSRLGVGGQGVVYLAEAPSGDRVAIKQLRFDPEDVRARDQFVKEVAAARLVAPFCTAQVLDAEVDGPSPYVISEFIEGQSLQQRIDRQGPMSGSGLQRLAIGTVTALAAIHQAGVVHRDFKPANVMLAADGPRVIDFGIARDLSMETTVTSRVFGTPAYMAPEQLRAERIGPPTDMFAWASVIAFAATGRAPFEAPHVAAVMLRISTGEPDLTGVPDALVGVLLACLAKDPAARPTAQETLALLLGRPLPAPSDANRVLSDAADLVHAAAASSTTGEPDRSRSTAAPTLFDTRSEPTAGTSAGAGTSPGAGAGGPWKAAAPPGAPAAPGGRGRILAVAALVLVLAFGGSYALARSGVLSGDKDKQSSIVPSGSGTSADGDPGPTSAGAPAPSATGAEPSDGPTSADPEDDDSEVTVPETFDGDWQGQVVVGEWQGAVVAPASGAVPFEVRLELNGGENDGELYVIGLNCSGPVRATSASDQSVVFSSPIENDPDRNCFAQGTLTLEKTGGAVKYEWLPDGHPDRTSRGVLQQR